MRQRPVCAGHTEHVVQRRLPGKQDRKILCRQGVRLFREKTAITALCHLVTAGRLSSRRGLDPISVWSAQVEKIARKDQSRADGREAVDALSI